MIQKIVLKWIAWRYGGGVHALKPPLGYNRYQKRSLGYKAAYWLKKGLWRFECRLFDKYGAPMREAWEKAFPANELADAHVDAVTRIMKRQQAGAQYLRGEITCEEYAALKAKYATRYAEAMKAMGAKRA